MPDDISAVWKPVEDTSAWKPVGGLFHSPGGSRSGLIEPGNLDLSKRPIIKNSDGTTSTVRSMSFNDNGVETLIPTAVGNRILSDQEAINHYRKTKEHLGKFRTPDEATAYAKQLHEDYANGTIKLQSNGPQLRPDRTTEALNKQTSVLGYEGSDDSSTLDKVINFLRPQGVSPAIAVGARAAAATPGTLPIKALVGAAAGTGTYFGLDKLLNQLKDKPSENPEEEAALNLAVNEGGSRAIQGAGRGVKELIKPGSVISNTMTKLEPTFGQLKQSVTDKSTPIIDWIERTFSPGGFRATQANSGNLAKQEIENLAAGVAGRNTTNPQGMSDIIQAQAQSNLSRIQQESNLKATTVKAIAINNPQWVPTEAPPPLVAPGPDQQLINGQWHRLVRGPIQALKSGPEAFNFLKNKQEFWGDLTSAQGEDKELINLAQGILKRTNGGTQPMSFEEAWDAKQQLTKYAWQKRIPGQVTHPQGLAGQLAESLDNDIEQGLKRLPAAGNQNRIALESYRAAKETVALRFATFGKTGIQDLVTETGSALPTITSYIKDPKKLQKLLDAGEIVLPNPSGGRGPALAPTKILSTNMRQDLGGHELTRLMQDNWQVSPTDPTKGRIDIGNMQQQLNDPTMQESYKLLWNSRQRGDIDQLFKNIALTQEKGTTPTRTGLFMRHGMVAIPAAAITGHLTNYTTGAALGGITEIGGFGLARMMQNPKLARALVAMSSGQAPNVSQQFLSRSIVGALQGTGAVINMIGNDGKPNKGTINSEGEWRELQ